MKYILLISLICSGIINGAFAQKNTSITRNGPIVNYNPSSINKLADAVPSSKAYKSQPKLKPVINSESTLFYESFDNVPGYANNGNNTYNFPTGWLRFNIDGRAPDTQVAFVTDAWVRREIFMPEPIADSVAFSTSFTSPSGQADDWMWTPLISNISANSVLKWSALTTDPQFPDGYEVRVMRASQGPPTAGVGNIGNLITNSTQVFAVAAEASVWTNHQINLGDYENDAIYIGFRNNSNDKFLLLIDDVYVENLVADDLAILQQPQLREYGTIPLSEVVPITFRGQVSNVGLTQVNSAKLHVDVIKDSETYTSIASFSSAIAPHNSKIFTIPVTYTPKTVGIYSFKFYHSFENTDLNPANDVMYSSTFRVSQNVFSRVNSNSVGTIGIGAGPNKNSVLATVFTLNNTEKVRGILVGIKPNAGTKVKARIYGAVNGIPDSPYLPLWESTEITFTGTESQYTFFSGNTPPTLSPGIYLFGCVEVDSTLAIYQHDNIFTPITNIVSWADNPDGANAWTPVESFGPLFRRTLNINPVFECPDNVAVDTHITEEYIDKIANNSIVADKTMTNARVYFEARKSIILNPGFSVEYGRFKAQITNVCTNIDW